MPRKPKVKRLLLSVVPCKGYGWAIKLSGREKGQLGRDGIAKGHMPWYITKDEAIRVARKFARENKPSRINVYKKNGRIQTEWTYGKDPPEIPG